MAQPAGNLCHERLISPMTRDLTPPQAGPAGHAEKADSLARQANAYVEQGRHGDAIDTYLQAIELDPKRATLPNNLGVVLRQLNHLNEAEACFKQAIDLDPAYADAYRNLGVVYGRQNRVDEAAQAFSRSMQLNPNNPALYSDLGNFLYGQQLLSDAIESYETALRLQPDFPVAQWNHGLACLMKGDLEKGWPGNELRHLFQTSYPHQYAKPRWEGQSFHGKRLLIYDEIGYGDVFQFVRYLPMVKALGGTLLFEAKPGLKRLLQEMGCIDVLLERGALPVPEVDFDLHLPMESLPFVFKTSLDTIPRKLPYLHAHPDLVKKWSGRLEKLSSPRIGVVWAGNPDSAYDQNRSCQAQDFLPLFRMAGVSWFSLQKGAAEEQLRDLAGAEHVQMLGGEIEDFADTAAIIQNLDLVISVETAVPHLAGALNKPVWTLLSSMPAWRWMLEREDSPWYPGMRLFRQSQAGIWQDVVGRIAIELEQWRSSYQTEH